jgi:hypothetical protein
MSEDEPRDPGSTMIEWPEASFVNRSRCLIAFPTARVATLPIRADSRPPPLAGAIRRAKSGGGG